MRERLDAIFRTDLTGRGPSAGQVGGPGLQTGPTPGVFELALDRAITVTITDLREDIEHGQYVSRYALTGLDAETRAWRPLASGTTVGYRKLDRIPAATISAVRLSLDTIDGSAPRPLRISLY
jgi:alpha-L-fucosidase